MTIDEAIVHARKVAQEKYNEGFLCHANPNDDKLDNCIECAKEHEQFAEWLEELKCYKQLKGKGLLLELSCKEVYKSNGDTVYYIFKDKITECINCGVSINVDGKLYFTLICDEKIFPFELPIEEWNKIVFLTREEAEEVLKKMNKTDKRGYANE